MNVDIEEIRKNPNSVDWYFISRHRSIPEDFIREFKDKVDWRCISEYQTLSEF